MPLPLAPAATIALRYGAAALAAYAVTRRIERGRRDQRAEDALDELPEGMTLRRDGDQRAGTWRFRRIVRLGTAGPGVEIDASLLGRIRFSRV